MRFPIINNSNLRDMAIIVQFSMLTGVHLFNSLVQVEPLNPRFLNLASKN